MSRKVAAAAAAGQDEVAEPEARQEEVTRFLRDYESVFRAAARRCSLSAEDAEDALQRAIEILVSRAPTMDRRARVAWMYAVVRHEAMRIRRRRRRAIPGGEPIELTESDGVRLLEGLRPESFDPAEMYERQDQFARFRQSFRRLKREERRALSLIGEGYSYSEIESLTGWSNTKINRLLSEGRTKMREMLGHLESGRRCAELVGPLSRFCDGEASEREERELRDHLTDCMACRARLRSYRLTSGTAALILPLAPVGGRLGGYLQEAASWLQSRMPGRGQLTEAALALPTTPGGGGGGGFATLAKLAVVCVGIGGGTGACLATGVLPIPDLAGRTPPKHTARQAPKPAAHPTDLPAWPTSPQPTTTPAKAEAGTGVEGDEPGDDRKSPGPVAPSPRPEQAEFGLEAAGRPIALPRAGSLKARGTSAPAEASRSSTGAAAPGPNPEGAPAPTGRGADAAAGHAGAGHAAAASTRTGNGGEALPPVRPPLSGGGEFAP